MLDSKVARLDRTGNRVLLIASMIGMAGMMADALFHGPPALLAGCGTLGAGTLGVLWLTVAIQDWVKGETYFLTETKTPINSLQVRVVEKLEYYTYTGNRGIFITCIVFKSIFGIGLLAMATFACYLIVADW
jgi:hypothetical protein